MSPRMISSRCLRIFQRDSRAREASLEERKGEIYDLTLLLRARPAPLLDRIQNIQEMRGEESHAPRLMRDRRPTYPPPSCLLWLPATDGRGQRGEGVGERRSDSLPRGQVLTP